MARFVSSYSGKLKHGGKTISNGDEVDLGADDLDNLGVNEWVAAGWLTKVGSKAKAEPEA